MVPPTKQISVRLPLEIAEQVEARGAIAPYVIDAVREKLKRDQEAQMEDGFALLAASPEMWDMDLPTGAQVAGNLLLSEEEARVAPKAR